MLSIDKNYWSLHILFSFWLNGWVFVYELSGCGFQSHCSHLNFRFRACFEQGVPWHSGNYWVWLHSETRTWYDKNIQSLPVSFLIKLQAENLKLSATTGDVLYNKMFLKISQISYQSLLFNKAVVLRSGNFI